MTTAAPNAYSPYADADPRYRHLFAVPALLPNPLRPGSLGPTGCDRLAVVPEDPQEAPQSLPDGLCPLCAASYRNGAPLGDSRPLWACRECGLTTRHDGLCAVCRTEAHDTWWPTRQETSDQ